MTSASAGSIRVVRFILILFGILSFPATARLQEQASPATAPSGTAQEQQTAPGMVSVPTTTAPAAAAQEQQYTIKEGDTLWDIAASFYRDPFLWPLIWQTNPFIADPDLIYPGRTLVIPSLAPVERAMREPQEYAPAEEKPVAEKAAPEPAEPPLPSFFRTRSVESSVPEPETPARGAILVMPEEKEPPLLDKYAMLSAGFVSEEESDDYVIGSANDPGKSIFGQDDTVYIAINSRPSVNVGDRFLIFQPVHRVKHPVTKRYFGELYKVNGVLKVTKVNEEGSTTATASIILSFDAAEKGSLLTPYQEPTLLYPLKEKHEKNLSGHILEVTDRRTINAQVDIIYLDKGKEDGVAPGDRFTVYTEGGNGAGVDKTIAEIEVFLVKERTATAIVRKSVDALTRGDRYVSKN